MAEDDHDKYRPDADDGNEGDDERSNSRSRKHRRDGEREQYVHAPAVDVEALDEESEPDEVATDAGAKDDSGTADADDAPKDPDEPDGTDPDVEWVTRADAAAGVETPVPRNLVASIVAVFLVLGGTMALLGLLFAGLGRDETGLTVLGSVRQNVALLSPQALVYAIPAQAGVIAVVAGFYAGTRDEGTEAVVAGALGTFLGTALETVLVTLFVSASADLNVQYRSLAFSALFLAAAMALVAAGCALLYDRFITHPDGLLGRVSERLAPEEQRKSTTHSRK